MVHKASRLHKVIIEYGVICARAQPSNLTFQALLDRWSDIPSHFFPVSLYLLLRVRSTDPMDVQEFRKTHAGRSL